MFDIAIGRLSRNVVMTGNVHLNGKKRRLEYGGVVSNFYISFQALCLNASLKYSNLKVNGKFQ